MEKRKLKIGLLGCGNVGRGFVELIGKNNLMIRQRSGVELSISRILVRDLAKERPGVDPVLLTTDPNKVLKNGCDVVVELVGGIEPARTFIQESLAGGKHVVTANKALLALDGFSLMKTAATHRLNLGFEASVCGGIPIIRALRNGLVGNNIQGLSGILNGTCNYILTRMTEDRVGFETALQAAQVKGFAEADPTLDVDGHDAAQKLKILAELAFNAKVGSDGVETEGIRDISADDIQAADELGYVIKHVATAEICDGELSLQVAPVFLPRGHQLSAVREENNAVLLRGDAVGEMLFCGKGAGSLPSASAVLSDVVDIASNQGGFLLNESEQVNTTSRDKESKHYLRFPVESPRAIGAITTILERDGIGVLRAAAVWAKDEASQHHVRVLTLPVQGQKVRASLHQIRDAGLQEGRGTSIRVEQ